ncbi:MAG: zf-HC2 domain-containing protein, partial [Candidatus Angelobacter sp.]
MSKSNHPIEQEELMAYLDGELATNRAIAAAAHLEHCAQCQELAADLKGLSREMLAWEVGKPNITEISNDLALALEKRKREPNKQGASVRRWWSMLFTRRKLVFAGGSTAVILFVLSY